jgi:PBP1b-binding outer membrane lipoprotein LpoB
VVTKIVISVIIILSVFAFVSGCVEETNVSKTKASPASELQHDNASLKTDLLTLLRKYPVQTIVLFHRETQHLLNLKSRRL